MVLLTGSLVTIQGIDAKVLKFSIEQGQHETTMYGRIESEKKVKLSNKLSNINEILTYVLLETFPKETINKILLI